MGVDWIDPAVNREKWKALMHVQESAGP